MLTNQCGPIFDIGYLLLYNMYQLHFSVCGYDLVSKQNRSKVYPLVKAIRLK